MTDAVRIAVLGAAGRMGRAIVERVVAAEDLVLAAAIVRDTDAHPELGGIATTHDLRAALSAADVLVDFSLPDACAAAAQACAEAGVAYLCGVTGLSDEQAAAVDACGDRSAVLRAANTSLGVNLMLHLLEQVRGALPEAAVRIHEVHHAAKLDAPSGTALCLGLVTGVPAEAITHERTGEVPGEHEVSFDLGSELLELNHRVSDRGVFADGALVAARWLAGREPGRYSMAEVLGL